MRICPVVSFCWALIFLSSLSASSSLQLFLFLFISRHLLQVLLVKQQQSFICDLSPSFVYAVIVALWEDEFAERVVRCL